MGQQIRIIRATIKGNEEHKKGEEKPDKTIRTPAFDNLLTGIGFTNDITSSLRIIQSNTVISHAIRVELGGANILLATMTLESMLIDISEGRSVRPQDIMSFISSVAGVGAMVTLIMGAPELAVIYGAVSASASIASYFGAIDFQQIYKNFLKPVIDRYFESNPSAAQDRVYSRMVMTPDLFICSPIVVTSSQIKTVVKCRLVNHQLYIDAQEVDSEELNEIAAKGTGTEIVGEVDSTPDGGSSGSKEGDTFNEPVGHVTVGDLIPDGVPD